MSVKNKFRITIEDTETGESRTIEVSGYMLGRAETDELGEIDYTLVYDGLDKGGLTFINKMLDVEVTAMILENMGII